MSKTIPLTRGYVTVVDDADFELLSSHKWYATGTRWVYAARSVRDRETGTPRCVLMHREILGLTAQPRAVYADHINGDTLNNRRANLRITDNKGNQGNRKFMGGTSKYRGVCWDKNQSKWRARIRKNRKLVYLGSFKDETDAARAYDTAAREHFGAFAKTNFPS